VGVYLNLKFFSMFENIFFEVILLGVNEFHGLQDDLKKYMKKS